EAVKKLLATELKDYAEADGVVATAKAEGRWKDATDAVGVMKGKAVALTSALPKAKERAAYEAAYTQPIKEAHEKAKEVLKTATEPMKTKLDTEFKAYEPKAAAHDNAVTGKD